MWGPIFNQWHTEWKRCRQARNPNPLQRMLAQTRGRKAHFRALSMIQQRPEHGSRTSLSTSLMMKKLKPREIEACCTPGTSASSSTERKVGLTAAYVRVVEGQV